MKNDDAQAITSGKIHLKKLTRLKKENLRLSNCAITWLNSLGETMDFEKSKTDRFEKFDLIQVGWTENPKNVKRNLSDQRRNCKKNKKLEIS